MTGGDLNFIRAVTDKNTHKDISIMANELKDYCKEHGYDNPKFWPASCTKDYAVSIRMRDNDRWGWEEFDANVIFILGEHSKNEAKLIGLILKELRDPVVLIVPLAISANKQSLYNSHGFLLVPARWTNNLEEFEIYIKGQMSMGGFVNLMEQVERIGSKIVTIKRPLKQVFLSFLYFKVSRQLYAFLNLLIIGWIGYYPIGYFKNAIKIVIFLYTLSPLTQTI